MERKIHIPILDQLITTLPVDPSNRDNWKASIRGESTANHSGLKSGDQLALIKACRPPRRPMSTSITTWKLFHAATLLRDGAMSNDGFGVFSGRAEACVRPRETRTLLGWPGVVVSDWMERTTAVHCVRTTNGYMPHARCRFIRGLSIDKVHPVEFVVVA